MEKNIINKERTENSLIKNSVWFLINNVLNMLFPFASGIYIARVMLPSYIGLVSSAQNFVQYFVILAFLGIPTYGVKEIAKNRGDKNKLNQIFSELVIINFISTLIFSALYFSLVLTIQEYKEYIELYLVSGGLVVLNSLNISWLYEGLEKFKFTSIRNIFVKALSFCILVIFVKNNEDYLLYAGISVISIAANYLINCITSQKHVSFTIRNINIKKHIKPILYLASVNIAIEIYTLVDVTMLGFFTTDDHIAFYKYGSSFAKIFLQVINTFTMVLVPKLSILYKENKLHEYNHYLTFTLKLIFLLSIPMIIGIQFVSSYLICLIYGEAYINSAHVLRIICLTSIISPIGYLLGSRTLLVTNNEKKMIIPVSVGAIINVLGNLLFIPMFQEFGAALATIISEFVIMVIYIITGKKYFKLEKWLKDLFKIIVSAIIMLITLVAISTVNNQALKCVLEITCSILVYFGVLIVMREEVIIFFVKKIKDALSKKGG